VGAEARIEELGIELPPVAVPVASYVPVVLSGGFAFVAGQVPLSDGAPMWIGRVGQEIDLDTATRAARRCGLQVLAALRAATGSLDHVRRIVRVAVFVASGPGFTEHPKVANGASDLFVEVFGEAGRHARVSVGAPGLPLGVPVEVEVVAEIEPGRG